MELFRGPPYEVKHTGAAWFVLGEFDFRERFRPGGRAGSSASGKVTCSELLDKVDHIANLVTGPATVTLAARIDVAGLGRWSLWNGQRPLKVGPTGRS